MGRYKCDSVTDALRYGLRADNKLDLYILWIEAILWHLSRAPEGWARVEPREIYCVPTENAALPRSTEKQSKAECREKLRSLLVSPHRSERHWVGSERTADHALVINRKR